MKIFVIFRADSRMADSGTKKDAILKWRLLYLCDSESWSLGDFTKQPRLYVTA